MRRIIILLSVVMAMGYGTSATVTISANAQASDPCAGAIPAGDVGLNYEGHCILVEPEKGPVQGIIVRRVEDLDNVTIHGIIVAHTETGWKILPDEFVQGIDDRQFATAAVGDSYHIVMDETE